MTVPGVSFEGQWQESEFLKRPEIARALHWKQPERTQVLAAANDYAEAQLRMHREYATSYGLPGVAQAIGELEGKLAEVRSSGKGCLLSIGWGGGFLSKVPYVDTQDEAYRQILRALPFYSRAIQTGLPFPKTRRIIFLENRPGTVPGWVHLEIE